MLTVQVMRRCVFMVRMGYVAVVLPVLSSGIRDSINKCGSKCISISYDYTKVHDLLYDGISIVQTRA